MHYNVYILNKTYTVFENIVMDWAYKFGYKITVFTENMFLKKN